MSFTPEDEAFASSIGVIIDHRDVRAAQNERDFALEMATVAQARESHARYWARLWRERCLVACILLGAAMLVIELMAVGRL